MQTTSGKTIALLLMCIVHFACVSSPEKAERAMNPIAWTDVPDNAVIRVGDTYYMSSTTMHLSPGLPLMKSKNLVDWEIIGYAYDTLVDNDAMNMNNGRNCYGAGSWASSLRHHDGVFYVSTFSSTSGKTHVYSTTDIEKGVWRESSFAPALHDHSLFFDDDGRTYMVYGSGEIRIVELTADASAPKEGGLNQTIVPDADLPAGGKRGLPAEGSQMFKIDGKYYLFNITWQRNDMRVALVHRADKITGPYEGRVFLRDRGIAQGSLVDTPEGDRYALMFRDFGAVGRVPYLIPVEWKEGFPVAANEGKVPDRLDIPVEKDNRLKIVASDEFTRGEGERALPLAWQWNHNPDNGLWSVDARPGYLRLTTGSVVGDVLSAKNTLTQRTFGPECSAVVAMETDSMKDGDYAGLVALQKHYGSVGVKMDGGVKYIVMQASRKDETSVEHAAIPLDETRVYLGIACDYNPVNEERRNDKAYFYYSLDGIRWKPIGTPLQMYYTLPHFIGYRFGLFNFATKTSGGYVDFDYFRINYNTMFTTE